MTTTMSAGVNIYSIIGLLVAASLLFHFTSEEETFIMSVAAIVIIYFLMG